MKCDEKVISIVSTVLPVCLSLYISTELSRSSHSRLISYAAIGILCVLLTWRWISRRKASAAVTLPEGVEPP
jgi:hypothetical protein